MPEPFQKSKNRNGKRGFAFIAIADRACYSGAVSTKLTTTPCCIGENRLGQIQLKPLNALLSELSSQLDDKRITIEYQKVQIHIPQNNGSKQ